MNALTVVPALAVAGLASLAPAPSSAAGPDVHGTWKLASYVREEVGGAATQPWGEKPGGYLTLLPDGRMTMVITAEGRAPVAHDDPALAEKSAKLLSTVTAYAGRYEVKERAIVFQVEVAWRPDWVGTEQRRELVLEGDRMILRTQPMRSATTGKESVYVLTWVRAR